MHWKWTFLLFIQQDLDQGCRPKDLNYKLLSSLEMTAKRTAKKFCITTLSLFTGDALLTSNLLTGIFNESHFKYRKTDGKFYEE